MKRMGLDIKDVSQFEDDLVFELFLWKNMEELASGFLRTSPFGAGLLLYFIIIKRGEINKLKVITKFVKEELDRKDLKYFLGIE